MNALHGAFVHWKGRQWNANIKVTMRQESIMVEGGA